MLRAAFFGLLGLVNLAFFLDESKAFGDGSPLRASLHFTAMLLCFIAATVLAMREDENVDGEWRRP